MKQYCIVFASGTPTDGGTGAENLARKLPENILAFVSNNEHGGVAKRAEALKIPFTYFSGPYTAEGYSNIVQKILNETAVRENNIWYALSGWFTKVYWLSPARTFNIHPAPLPRFEGMYGEKLHRMVWEAYMKGEISEGEVVMHFVTSKIDDGPIFFRFRFPLSGIKDYEDYRAKIRIIEHGFQPHLTKLVMDGSLSWDGYNPGTLRT